MLFFKGVLALTFTALVTASTFTTVVNDLQTIDTDTKQCTTLLNGFTGTGAQFLQIRSQLVKIRDDLNRATADFDSLSPPESTAQGNQIFTYWAQTPLYPDTQSFLNAYVSKQTIFRNAGAYNEYCGYLSQLRTATDNLAVAIIAKFPTSSLQSQGQTARSNYATRYNQAKTGTGCP